MATYASVSTKQLVVAEKKTFDPTDPENQQFLNSVEKVGIIHPIVVRKDGDSYLVVAGRKRLWAAKYQKLPEVPIIVELLTDEEAQIISRIENRFRSHLTGPQKIRELERIYKLYDAIYGKDPGKAIGGMTRAEQASRNKDGKFSLEPASANTALAGETPPAKPPEPPPKPVPKSHKRRINEETGESLRSLHRVDSVRKALGEEYLTALDDADISLESLEMLCMVPEPRRGAMVGHIANGASYQQAVEKTAPVADKVAAKALEARPDDSKVPDKEFLEVVCGDARKRIQNPAAYDRDALLYLHDTENRESHRAEIKKEIGRSLKIGFSPLAQRTMGVLFPEHPRDWKACSRCLGKNVDMPDCPECHGVGYRIRQSAQAHKEK